MKYLGIILLLMVTCCGHATSQTAKGPTASYEVVDICRIVSDPAAFNQKLIEITAFASHGFEDSSIFDPSCSKRFGIWMEFGGINRTGTIYCCGVGDARKSPEILSVEGIATSLKDDDKFKIFDRLLHDGSGTNVRATLRGRFFAGEKSKWPKGEEYWGGYGHFGCCTLFVVEEVVSIEPHDLPELDYSSAVDQPDLDKEGCGSMGYLYEEKPSELIKLQQGADSGTNTWLYDQPQRVAAEALAKELSVPLSRIRLVETRRLSSLVVYYWRPNGKKGVRYMVVVNRPYWLSFHAKDRAKTIWTVAQIYSICA